MAYIYMNERDFGLLEPNCKGLLGESKVRRKLPHENQK
jgi:hypothetical protein